MQDINLNFIQVGKRKVIVQYSPDLTPLDFWFSYLKRGLDTCSDATSLGSRVNTYSRLSNFVLNIMRTTSNIYCRKISKIFESYRTLCIFVSRSCFLIYCEIFTHVLVSCSWSQRYLLRKYFQEQ